MKINTSKIKITIEKASFNIPKEVLSKLMDDAIKEAMAMCPIPTQTGELIGDKINDTEKVMLN